MTPCTGAAVVSLQDGPPPRAPRFWLGRRTSVSSQGRTAVRPRAGTPVPAAFAANHRSTHAKACAGRASPAATRGSIC